MSHYHRLSSCGRDENKTISCDLCRKYFDQKKSVCAFCCAEVDNKTFLGSTYHQTGKCKPKPFKVPKQTPLRKACNNPALGRVDYDSRLCNCRGRYGDAKGNVMHRAGCKPYIPPIESYADLAAWWGLPTIGQGGD